MYDEDFDHLAQGLYDMWFFREFLRRTGMIDELNEKGWGFGIDMNGGWDKEIYNIDVVFDLLAPTLEVDLFHGGDPLTSDSEGLFFLSGEEVDEATLYQINEGLTLCLSITGDEDEVEMWSHFLNWLKPDEEWHLIRNVLDDRPNIIMTVPLDLADYIEILSVILQAWEVKEYYDNVANASSWRELRQQNSTNTYTKQSPAA